MSLILFIAFIEMEEVKKNNGYDYMAKIIIIGDSGVGKTNFITRLCENHFK